MDDLELEPIVQFERTEPLYRQLYEELRLRIVGEDLRPGEHLPPTRTLALELGVSRNVVTAAYEALLAEGYVQARVGHGTWVSRDLPDDHLTAPGAPPASGDERAAEPLLSELARHALTVNGSEEHRAPSQNPSDIISFSVESAPADRASIDAWNRLLRTRLRRLPKTPRPPEDSPELRRALAQHLSQSRGISADPDRILILADVRRCIDLVGRALLQQGSQVLIEDPGRRCARLAFEAIGARLVTCPVDREGMDIARAAPEEMQPPRATPPPARLAYVTPSHQFPTGVIMSAARRRELLAWAADADAMVIEDDRDGAIRFDGRPQPAIHALDTESRVIYLGTLSHTLHPDLRLGYVVLPPSLVRPVTALKRLFEWSPPTTTQEALADFLAGGHYDRHLRRLRHKMASLRRTLIDSLEDRFGDAIEITGAASGLHVVVWFREWDGGDAEDEILAVTRQLGVEVAPVSQFCLATQSRPGFLLGYSGLSESKIRIGVHRLFMAWRAVHRTLTEAAPAI